MMVATYPANIRAYIRKLISDGVETEEICRIINNHCDPPRPVSKAYIHHEKSVLRYGSSRGGPRQLGSKRNKS